ncbi:MAG: acyltransferase [Pseudomonadota bacterium]
MQRNNQVWNSKLLRELNRVKSKAPLEYFIHLLQRVRGRIFTLFMKSLFYSIGRGTVVEPPLQFANLRGVALGHGVYINRFSWIIVHKTDGGDSQPKLIIKDNAGIGMNATISAAKKIVIEENVMLGRNVYISDHGHEFADISVPIMHQGMRKVTEVRIGAGTWIGQNAAVLPGAQIGRNCVIGANSVVNSEIPDFSVAVGAPAKIVAQYSKSKKEWIRIRRDE